MAKHYPKPSFDDEMSEIESQQAQHAADKKRAANRYAAKKSHRREKERDDYEAESRWN
jgi:hypothetical protein